MTTYFIISVAVVFIVFTVLTIVMVRNLSRSREKFFDSHTRIVERDSKFYVEVFNIDKDGKEVIGSSKEFNTNAEAGDFLKLLKKECLKK